MKPTDRKRIKNLLQRCSLRVYLYDKMNNPSFYVKKNKACEDFTLGAFVILILLVGLHVHVLSILNNCCPKVFVFLEVTILNFAQKHQPISWISLIS